jgi:hypothetical protein
MQNQSLPAQPPLAYEFRVARAPKYLHVSGAGENTAENLRRFLVDAHRAAIEHGCDSLLLEAKFAGPSLDLASLYSVIAERSPDGTQLKKIAFVDRNPEHSPERAEFAALAANRLGVNGVIFVTLEAAKEWLQSGTR